MSDLSRALPAILGLILAIPVLAETEVQGTLTLQRAEQLAIAEEPGTQALILRSAALASEAIAAGQLPDPQLQFSAANVPTDTFNFDQEPMTQLKLGVKQAIPEAGSLAARSGIREQQSLSIQWTAADRQLQVLRQVREDWLELYYWQQADAVVTESKTVFEQLLTVVNSLYQVGRKDQHDLLRAELELSRLDDRLINIADETSRRRANLSRWTGAAANDSIASALPQWELKMEAGEEWLLQHPAIISLDRQVDAGQHNIQLAESSYKPAWGVELNYGYREEDFNGRDLPDFFSAGVTVKLPLFTEKRQDKTYRASVQRHQAALSERQEKLIAMRAQLNNRIADTRHLKQRFELYQDTILVQASQQAESALKAYRSDAADFDEVMRSVLAELAIQLEYQRLRINYLQSLAQVKYLIDYNELKELTP